MRVLVLNPGSSTLKASLLDPERDDPPDIGVAEWPAGRDADAPRVVADALAQLPATADAVGYRVVHGGSRYRAATRVDDELLDAVEALDALAPLHNHRAALVMRAAGDALPDLPHVACFDTAFHATLPEEAWRYPLPADWVDRWQLRRFGFHGLSVAWSTRRAARLLHRPADALRLVVAHLGSGCSVTAVDGGRSVATSMGMTPYEGLMMGTRSGSIDPGVLLYLLRSGLSPDDLDEGLTRRSGLLGVAGVAGAREVEEAAMAGDTEAAMALDLFARSAAAGIAAAATALASLDALVFTGGIGEHADRIRGDIVRRLATLGVPGRLAPMEGDGVLADGPPAVLVVEAREDRVIAAEVAALLR
jgi:acetate kinase